MENALIWAGTGTVPDAGSEKPRMLEARGMVAAAASPPRNDLLSMVVLLLLRRL
jgi:hypothetical protein